MSSQENIEARLEAERITSGRFLSVVNAVENLQRSFEAEYGKTDPIADKVAELTPSGPTEEAASDMDALRNRISLLTQDRPAA